MREVRERKEQRSERSRLRQYAEAVFIPNLKLNGASKSHVERHTAAIAYLERFVKAPLRPEQLDARLLLSFDSWLWRQGISDSRRRDLTESLRRIAAAWVPDCSLLVKRCQRRPLPNPPIGSVRHFYENTYVPQRLLGRTARYIDENRAAFWRLYEHYQRDIMLNEQTNQLAAEHFEWLLQQGLKPNTINTGHKAVWFAVWRHAHSLGVISAAPTLRSLPVVSNACDSWDPEQIAQFIAACSAASPRPIAGINAGHWWEALVRIVWYTALRRASLLKIRRMPPDMNMQTGWLIVPGANMKNRTGQTFKLGLDALQAVARIWNPCRDYLLPYPYKEKGVFYDQFHRIREAAGLPQSRSHNGCLHLLRRSTATEVARQLGVGAAQALLGHSSPQLTKRNYIDPTKVPGIDYTTVLRPLDPKAAAAG